MKLLCDLPLEILLQICGLLKHSRRTLAQLRLTCRSLDVAASRFLFRKLYLGGSPLNRELIRYISQDNRFRPGVQKLEYSSRSWQRNTISNGSRYRWCRFEGADSGEESDESYFDEHRVDPDQVLAEYARRQHSDDKEHPRPEDCLTTFEYVSEFEADLTCIRHCIPRLTGLKKVVLGSLGRFGWEERSKSKPDTVTLSTADTLLAICDAITLGNIVITSLDCKFFYFLKSTKDFPTILLDGAQIPAQQGVLTPFQRLLGQLQSLYLCGTDIVQWTKDTLPQFFLSLLRRTQDLRRLHLVGSDNPIDMDVNFVEFWSGSWVWMHLRVLHLHTLSTDTSRLNHFLEQHAKTLRDLNFRDVELNPLGWQWVLQTIREHLVLKKLGLEYIREVRNRYDTFLLEDEFSLCSENSGASQGEEDTDVIGDEDDYNNAFENWALGNGKNPFAQERFRAAYTAGVETQIAD